MQVAGFEPDTVRVEEVLELRAWAHEVEKVLVRIFALDVELSLVHAHALAARVRASRVGEFVGAGMGVVSE